MIFLTVGSQLAFDRLVECVDEWASCRPALEVFAQTCTGHYRPRHMPYEAILSAWEAERYCREAELVIAHAGMGTILTCLREGTPLLVMPRRAVYEETRNDHQVATARALARHQNIHVAMDELELADVLDEIPPLPEFRGERAGETASAGLIGTLRSFIEG